MQKRRARGTALLLAIMTASFMAAIGNVQAATSNSDNYRITETQFGSSAVQKNCSGNFCARVMVGGVASEQIRSDSMRVRFNVEESLEPSLQIITQLSVQDLGLLDTDRTATSVSVVKVKNTLVGGYAVMVTGKTPSQGDYNLRPLSEPTVSEAGKEQFGINVAANTEPNIGVRPRGEDQFSQGQAADDYGRPNVFKFVSGDTIAFSRQPNDETTYTISMIINIANSTPSGLYSGDYQAVVIPVY